MPGRRFLVPFAALLAMAAVPLFSGGSSSAQSQADAVASGDPAPSRSVELRVWQRVAEPLRLWVSSRTDADSSWSTRELDLAMIEGGGWRAASRTVDASGGPIELRVWQHPGELSRVYLSARAGGGGSWDEYGTQRVALNAAGPWRYGELSLALAWPDADAPLPGSEAVTLCIPEGLETETLSAYVWHLTGTSRYWISSRPDRDAAWRTRELAMAATGEDGWSAGALTVDAGEADFELHLWARGNARHLSARVAGTPWDEYGTQSVTLNRRSGNYPYASRTITLTLPEPEPPRPGASARTWDCSGPDNRAPHADAGSRQTVRVGATVTLDGSGSSDPDGDDITYAWTQTGGTYAGTVALTGDDTATPSFAAGAALGGKTVVFTLQVTDGGGLSSTDTVEIAVLVQQQGGGAPPGGVFIPPTSPGQQDNEAPTANAGPDQHAAPGATVTLDGSGSTDPERATLTYRWAMTADGTYDGNQSISPGTAVTPSFTMPSDAAIGETLIFRLTVTDNGGKTDTDTVAITTNTPPAVEAGAAQTVLRDATVTLSGTVTESDPGQTVSYQWTKTGGTYAGQIQLTGDTTLTAGFTMPKAATHGQTVILALTATDSLGGVGADTVTITARNRAPTGADAGTDANAVRGSAVTLVDCPASASDPDGDTMTCSWAKTGGTYTGTIEIKKTTSTSFVMPTAAATSATVVLTLTVSDGYGGSDTDDVTYTATNATPTASAGDDANAGRGSTVTLDGSGSSDPDGTPSYSWSQTSGSPTVTLSSTTAQSPTFTMPTSADVDAELVFTLTVTDADNATATDTVTITAKNVAPTVNAGSDVNATAGVAVTLSPTANDPDGDNDDIDWEWSATPASANALFSDRQIKNPTFTPNTTDAAGTTYTLTLEVTDEDGAEASDTLTLTVATANSGPSSAEAGQTQTVGQGATVTLSGSGSDPENDALTYSWEKTGGTYTGSLPDLSGASPTFAAPDLTGLTSSVQHKTIVWTLTVSDAANRTATDTVAIIVQNTAPTITVPGSANVTASNSYSPSATADDPDGDNDDITWSWSWNAPASLITGANTATPSFAIPNGYVGLTYTVTVTVTDEDGGTAAGSITLTIHNRAPNAVASGTSAGLDGARINLFGISSTDPDQGQTATLTCSFAKTGGTYTSSVTINHANFCSSAYFTMPSDATSGQTIIVTLTVTDSKGGTDTDDWTVTASTPNQAPTAAAGDDQNVTAGATVALDGSGSSDPNGDTLTYQWSQYGGTYTGSITLNNPTSATPTFTWPSDAGIGKVISLRLTVSDGKATGADYVLVRRVNGLPTVSIDGGDRTEYRRTDAVARSFDLAATVGTDPDGHTLTYTWLVRKVGSNDAPAGVSIAKDATDPKKATVTISNAVAGSAGTDYQIFLTVRDSQGSTTTDAITMKLKTNSKPTVSITTADITGATPNRTYDLAASAGDGDSHALTYTWTAPAGSGMSFTNGNTATPTLNTGTTVTAGTYTITVTVSDGIETTSDTMTVTVQ